MVYMYRQLHSEIAYRKTISLLPVVLEMLRSLPTFMAITLIFKTIMRSKLLVAATQAQMTLSKLLVKILQLAAAAVAIQSLSAAEQPELPVKFL